MLALMIKNIHNYDKFLILSSQLSQNILILWNNNAKFQHLCKLYSSFHVK